MHKEKRTKYDADCSLFLFCYVWPIRVTVFRMELLNGYINFSHNALKWKCPQDPMGLVLSARWVNAIFSIWSSYWVWHSLVYTVAYHCQRHQRISVESAKDKQQFSILLRAVVAAACYDAPAFLHTAWKPRGGPGFALFCEHCPKILSGNTGWGSECFAIYFVFTGRSCLEVICITYKICLEVCCRI